MKHFFFFALMIPVSFYSNAQKTAQPVILLDKLNVLYYGIDNPVSISSPADFSQTTVTITNGTITGSGTHRVVRPASVGENSVITVTANGQSVDYYFRVKRIPDPIFKIGSGMMKIDINEFRVQRFCRAELENFDFDLRYKVLSATVIFSGKGFEEARTVQLVGNKLTPLSAEMARCEPGTLVTFEDIKVEGLDGIRTLESRTYTLF